MQSVETEFLRTFNDGHCLRNMDETHVSAEFGRKKEVLCSSKSPHGGFVSTNLRNGSGKYVIVVLAVLASGMICPPFFIVAGVRLVTDWYKPIQKYNHKLNYTSMIPVYENEWFTKDAVVCMTHKVSMDQKTIPLLIEHLSRFVRRNLCEGQYVLLLYGHASRRGVE